MVLLQYLSNVRKVTYTTNAIKSLNSQFGSLMLYLNILIILSACIHIYDKYKKMSWLSMIFKPLTTFLIFIYALILLNQHNLGNHNILVWIILVGLLCSLLGDVFLLSQREIYFTLGLLSFLIAHILYSYAFFSLVLYFNWYVLILLLCYGLIFYYLLYKNLGKDVIAVAIYILVILIMVWLAVCLWLSYRNLLTFIVMLGSFLFAFSDSVLAWDKFNKALKHEPSLVMVSYYLAQYCIVVFFISAFG